MFFQNTQENVSLAKLSFQNGLSKEPPIFFTQKK